MKDFATIQLTGYGVMAIIFVLLLLRAFFSDNGES